MTGVVYFLQVKGNGPVKIGHTETSVYWRIRALQQSSPYELEWVGFFVGQRIAETQAHRRLASSRLRNEWFYPTQPVLQFIKEKCPEFSQKTYEDDVFFETERAIVRRLIPPYGRDQKVVNELCRASGLSIPHLFRWLARRHFPASEKANLAAEFARSRIGVRQ